MTGTFEQHNDEFSLSEVTGFHSAHMNDEDVASHIAHTMERGADLDSEHEIEDSRIEELAGELAEDLSAAIEALTSRNISLQEPNGGLPGGEFGGGRALGE
ncbi:MAG: hypothetical protein COV36_00750 [Alphaproteobacteria bacterium CG11_big_fil_rev_8_21_14_0_20_44_7]|nr:MAG: hypothetical protein COV36_00750 [Alphaproteobacteria bacterium CG11_big_fil_rev_8_21_14_0_20_44_7]